ncbi:hypothetical protein G9A89_023902 [Geosiphon pyriformis]|nr:hypothetical protein G9A89_023902 [Geosiphon pyriformis]
MIFVFLGNNSSFNSGESSARAALHITGKPCCAIKIFPRFSVAYGKPEKAEQNEQNQPKSLWRATRFDGDSFLDRAWSELDNLELIFDGVNKPTLVSEWNCTDTTIDGLLNLSSNERVRICEFKNFCVDRDRGAFLVQNSSKPRPPVVNLIASGKEADRKWSPHIFAQFPSRRYSFIDEKVFVYGLFSPYDFGHWMFNGLLPLWSVMRSYNATADSWLFRADVFDGIQAPSRFDMSYLSSKGRDIVLDPLYKTTAFQILAPGGTVPVCFTRAVVGLGNRCSHKSCDANIAGDDGYTLKKHIFEHYKVDIESLANVTAEREKQEEERPSSNTITENEDIVKPTLNSSLRISIPKDFKIGLIERNDVQQIVNFDELYNALENRGYRPHIITHSSDKNDEFIGSAFLFRNLTLLIGSHGNALSNALFMPQSSTILSISPRFGNDGQEAWFAGPMLSLGRRFYDWECLDESCVETDRALARQCIEKAKLEHVIIAQEFEEFVKLEHDVAHFTRNLKDITKVQSIIAAWWCYVRDVPRKADINLLVSMVDRILQDYIDWSPKITLSAPATNNTSSLPVASETTLQEVTEAKPETKPTETLILSSHIPLQDPITLEDIDFTGIKELNSTNKLESQTISEEVVEKLMATKITSPTTATSISLSPTISSPSFPEICRQAKCCGPKCELSMKRNVFGLNNAWKQNVEPGLEARFRARNWKLAEFSRR